MSYQFVDFFLNEKKKYAERNNNIQVQGCLFKTELTEISSVEVLFLAHPETGQ